mgnify:CR=1 FL=1
MSKTFSKLLTKNDTGETGGHQGGICVPRANSELIKFLPSLNFGILNPYAWISCVDEKGKSWKMRYIYYNGETFSPPKSTRNEYRITCMTNFFSEWGASSGDSVAFSSTGNPGVYKICVEKNSVARMDENVSLNHEADNKVIKLRGRTRVY